MRKTLKISASHGSNKENEDVQFQSEFANGDFLNSNDSVTGSFVVDQIQIGTLVEPKALFCPQVIKDEPFICIRPNDSIRRWQIFIKMKVASRKY